MVFDTLGGIYRHLAARLRASGLPTADLDARWLTAAAADVAPQDVVLKEDEPLSRNTAKRALSFLARRLRGEPIDRILGFREFWGLRFWLEPDTLSPRPDSETLVEAALACFGSRHPSLILDLGTGTGALLIALLSEWPGATGVGVDKSDQATKTACRNALANAVSNRAHFVVADWAGAAKGPFDLILSNPPYIATAELPLLSPEVRDYDPALALDGGLDGLDAYRVIARQARGLLQPDGVLIVELGIGQEAAVGDLVKAAGFEVSQSPSRDLSGIPRALVARLAKKTRDMPRS